MDGVLKEMVKDNIVAGKYEHYRGGFFQVLGVGIHDETKEDLVVMVSLDSNLPGSRIRLQPLRRFSELVLWPDGFTRSRYTFKGDGKESLK